VIPGKLIYICKKIMMNRNLFQFAFGAVVFCLLFGGFFMPDSFKFVDGINPVVHYRPLFNFWAFVGVITLLCCAYGYLVIVGGKIYDKANEYLDKLMSDVFED